MASAAVCASILWESPVHPPTLCCICRQEAEECRKAAAAAGQEAEALQAALREVRGVLAQRKADASARSSQSAVVQALLAARSSGEIPGIHGRLGRQAVSLTCSRWHCCVQLLRVQKPLRVPDLPGSTLCMSGNTHACR